MATERAHAALTTRARRAATSEGYGPLRFAIRVNRGHDRRMSIAVVLLPVCAAIFLRMGWEVSPWSPGYSSILGVIASGGAGLIFLVLSIMFVVPLLRMQFGGGARWFVFEHGAVAERLGGAAYVWPHDHADIRYVCWEEPLENGFRNRPQVWVRFHSDGDRICFDATERNDRAALEDALRSLGVDTEPERIGPRRATQVPVPL